MSVQLDDELRAELDGAAHAVAFGPPASVGRPWALFGSAVMALHGLRHEIGDVDVFVQCQLWINLLSGGGWTRRAPDPADPPFLEREFNVGRVHLFFDWTSRDPEVDARQCLRAAEMVNGWPCTPLQIVRMQKAMSIPKLNGDGRAQKHRDDLELIDAWCAPDIYPSVTESWR